MAGEKGEKLIVVSTPPIPTPTPTPIYETDFPLLVAWLFVGVSQLAIFLICSVQVPFWSY